MISEQKNMKIPSELIPYCPQCGKPLTMNLRADDTFIEDEGWHKAAERYRTFIASRKNHKILFLELGVGYNTPVIIKYPFWQMTANNPKASYFSINCEDTEIPEDIKSQSVCIKNDIGNVLYDLLSTF